MSRGNWVSGRRRMHTKNCIIMNTIVSSKIYKMDACSTYSLGEEFEALGINREVFYAQRVERKMYKKRQKIGRTPGDYIYGED